MRTHEHYRDQAAGCRRLGAGVTDPELAAAIEVLARWYDRLAELWPVELVPALAG